MEKLLRIEHGIITTDKNSSFAQVIIAVAKTYQSIIKEYNSGIKVAIEPARVVYGEDDRAVAFVELANTRLTDSTIMISKDSINDDYWLFSTLGDYLYKENFTKEAYGLVKDKLKLYLGMELDKICEEEPTLLLDNLDDTILDFSKEDNGYSVIKF